MSQASSTTPDEKRFASWVHDHGRAVRGYLLAMTRHAADADDLLQDVFRRAWQARERYHESGLARAYLIRIADRLLSDRRRAMPPEIHLDGEGWNRMDIPTSMPRPEQRLEQEETRRQLHAALDNLTEPQRRVLLMRYYGELSFAEIAEASQCPLNTVLSHAHRGLQALRELFSASRT